MADQLEHKIISRYLFIAAVLMALAVGLGAFAAHGLKPILTTSQYETFQTGNKYHIYHSLAILICLSLNQVISITKSKKVIQLFILGIILFSGSLYLLSLRHLIGIADWTFLGPLTPLGGLCFIGAWSYLAFLSYRSWKS